MPLKGPEAGLEKDPKGSVTRQVTNPGLYREREIHSLHHLPQCLSSSPPSNIFIFFFIKNPRFPKVPHLSFRLTICKHLTENDKAFLLLMAAEKLFGPVRGFSTSSQDRRCWNSFNVLYIFAGIIIIIIIFFKYLYRYNGHFNLLSEYLYP